MGNGTPRLALLRLMLTGLFRKTGRQGGKRKGEKKEKKKRKGKKSIPHVHCPKWTVSDLLPHKPEAAARPHRGSPGLLGVGPLDLDSSTGALPSPLPSKVSCC